MSKETGKILIVETVNPAYFNLANRGFPANVAILVTSHTDAIRELSDNRFRYQAIAYDLEPFGSYAEIVRGLKEIRDYGRNIPIVAQTEPKDRRELRLDPIGPIAILEAGADNFMFKTDNPDLLPTYIAALNRRQDLNKNGLLPKSVMINGLEIDFTKREISGKSGQRIGLGKTEWRLLSFMCGHPGQILTHDRILEGVWDDTYVDDLPLLRRHISRLRRRLPGIVVTKPGIGYTIDYHNRLGPQT